MPVPAFDPYLTATAAVDARAGRLAGVVIEPLVQTGPGLPFHSEEMLARVREITFKRGVPLIADERFTGFGRLGVMFAHQAAAIDPDYKGKGLQVQFTVEDKTYFTMPWSGAATYRKAGSEWVENVCAENTHEYYSGTETQVPQADKPDF